MADLKNTNIDNNLELPQGTTAQRPASPQEGQIRYNTDLSTTEFYNGANWRPLSDTHAEATGGTVVDTDIGGVPYRIHYFTETGTDTLTVTNPGEVEYLIVAGGGGGGGSTAGGGGAGGVLTGSVPITQGSYTVGVGNGGQGSRKANDGAPNPTSGEDSTFFGITAVGGGHGYSGTGQSGQTSLVADSGGSGGGGGYYGGNNGPKGPGTFGTGISGQGNDGGDGTVTGAWGGGGGGGAGSPGLPQSEPNINRRGGEGISSLITGKLEIYAGGGGGGCDSNGFSIGGTGGGGNGADGANFIAQDGTPNTGGGGGGGGYYQSGPGGGNGGSGIVIVRYPRNSGLGSQPDRTVVATQPQNFQTVRDGLVLELDAGNPVSYPGSGTIWKNLQSNVDGLLQNQTTFVKDKVSAFDFNGSGDYVSIGNIPELNAGNSARTMFAWIYTLETKRGVIINQGGGGTTEGSFDFEVNVYTQAQNPTDFYGIHYWGNGITFDQEVVHNQWVFVAVSHQGGDLSSTNTFGLFNGTRMNLTGTSPINTNNSEVSIGDNPDNGGNDVYFKGKIGEVGIYNRGLTELELVNIFNNTRGRYGI